MITLETLRREKRAEILRIAETHGARNVRVFGSVVRGESGVDVDVVTPNSLHYIRDRVLAEAMPL